MSFPRPPADEAGKRESSVEIFSYATGFPIKLGMTIIYYEK